jgi:hypothetical protein
MHDHARAAQRAQRTSLAPISAPHIQLGLLSTTARVGGACRMAM